MKTWKMEQGLYKVSSPLVFDQLQTIILDVAKDVEKKQILDQCIHKASSLPKSKQLSAVLKEYYKSTQNEIKKQTPLTLFFGNPSLFYEIFWPEAREAIGRQYYILNFNSPIDLEMKLRFEMKREKLSSPRSNMLYVCSLGERIPVARVFIEEERTEIIPREMLVNKILEFLLAQDDVKYIIKELRLQSDDIGLLARQIIRESKPMFVQFQGIKEKSPKIISMEVVGIGSLIPLNGKTLPLRRRLSFFLRENLLSIPLEEVDVTLPVFPKSPTTVLWVYIFAPSHYDINPRRILDFRKTEMIYEDNAPQNPSLISYCFYRKDIESSMSPITFKFGITIPRPNKLWLAGLDKLLCAFLAIWLLSTLSYLSYLKDFLLVEILMPFRMVCKWDGFLEVTFTIVTLVFVARNWFFHELSAYRVCSRRFLWLLALIALFSLTNVFLHSNLSS